MNTLTLVCVLLCLAVVNGRHFDDRKDHDRLSDIDDQNEEYPRHREHTEPSRHRRRRWNMGYGYDYPPPPPHGYYPGRDYDRNQDLTKIIKLLEEISEYLRRPQPPPPPPQPIYIPYPVPYAFPQINSNCNQGATPNVTVRFPDMEDKNQNWGFVIPKDDGADDDVDYARPISFNPIKPLRPMKVPSPSVEHGSSQAQAQVTTAAPSLAQEPESLKPDPCSTAILACCADQNQRMCFSNFGCLASFDSENVCSSESIDRALASLKEAYSPIR